MKISLYTHENPNTIFLCYTEVHPCGEFFLKGKLEICEIFVLYRKNCLNSFDFGLKVIVESARF